MLVLASKDKIIDKLIFYYNKISRLFMVGIYLLY